MIVHYQQTLKKLVYLQGVGLHTGNFVTLKILPAPPNFGYKFQRIDLPDKPIIKADADLVTDTSRGTTIEQNGVKVSTVEHVLASLVGCGIDNALIEVDNQEMPILDGSAAEFVQCIKNAGVIKQTELREYLDIKEPLIFYDEKKQAELTIVPAHHYQVSVMIDFNSQVLGTQHFTLKNIEDFGTEIAPCRTFCFLHELEYLLENNLIKGGDLNNAIVVVDKVVDDKKLQRLAKLFHKSAVAVKSEGILNNLELHFPNEPARHKLLDVIGDLALIGMPIRGKVFASRPGHAANVAFAQKIKQYIKLNKHTHNAPIYDPNKLPIYGINKIAKALPHRYPFLLIDKIIEITENMIVGVKNVTINEPFFQGHFPNNPVMPGVLQIEAMAQTGGVLILEKIQDPENYITLFMKIDNARFIKKVIPGDTIIFKLELLSPIRRGICEMKGTAFVGNKIVCEAKLVAILQKIK